MNNFKLVNSEKNKNLIILDGYKFRYHKSLKNNFKRWACTVKTCKCFLKLNGENVIVEKSVEHNHQELNENIMNRQILSNKLKKKACDDLLSRPSTLLHLELSKGDIETLTRTDVSLIRRNIEYSRLKLYPTLPTSLKELHESLLTLNVKTNKD